MRIRFAQIGAAALMACFPTWALAANPQYRCEPGTVDKDAVAIAFPDVDVGAYSDPDENICTFAIGGASSDGATSSGSVSPIGEILGQARSGEVEPLVLRLLIPRSAIESDTSDLFGAIENLLRDNLPQLDTCISALEKFADGPPDPLYESDSALIYINAENDVVSLSCMIYRPGATNAVTSEVPTLLLYTRSHGRSDSLFVPKPALP